MQYRKFGKTGAQVSALGLGTMRLPLLDGDQGSSSYGAEQVDVSASIACIRHAIDCGADGCWFQNRNAGGHVDSLKNIKVVDTTGAGDIFGGSAVWKLLQTDKAPEDLDEAELREIVSFACRAAGLSTMKHGGISSVPDSIS